MQMRMNGAGPGKKIVIVLTQVLLLAYVVMILYPLFNMIASSFKSVREIMRTPFSLPQSFSFQNYITIWVDKGFSRYFFNSLWITALAMCGVVTFGSMASFGISRYRFRGSTLIYMLFLSGIMLPLKAAIIPLYQIIRFFDWVSKPWSVIFIFMAMGLPSTVFILSGFMKSIPGSLEEAARIDGASDLRIYSQIIMPITMPSVALVTIYNAVPIWNDFFFPLVFLQKDNIKTLPVGLTSFVGQYGTKWDFLFTGLCIAIVPVLLLYLLMSKYFIKGMTAGAVK